MPCMVEGAIPVPAARRNCCPYHHTVVVGAHVKHAPEALLDLPNTNLFQRTDRAEPESRDILRHVRPSSAGGQPRRCWG